MRTRTLGLTPLLILLALAGGAWAFVKLGEVGTTSPAPIPTPSTSPSVSPTTVASLPPLAAPSVAPTTGDMSTAIAGAITGSTPPVSDTAATVPVGTSLPPAQDVQPSLTNATIVCPGYEQQPFEARFRVQPGLGTQVYGQLRCGTPVFFTGQATTASGIQWRQVTYRGRTGWVALNYVSPWR